MWIDSNKQLLNMIRRHEVGIKYPDLIPCIAFNILIQKDTTIFNPKSYHHFTWWFHWETFREGYDYWNEIAITLKVTD